MLQGNSAEAVVPRPLSQVPTATVPRHHSLPCCFLALKELWWGKTWLCFQIFLTSAHVQVDTHTTMGYQGSCSLLPIQFLNSHSWGINDVLLPGSLACISASLDLEIIFWWWILYKPINTWSLILSLICVKISLTYSNWFCQFYLPRTFSLKTWPSYIWTSGARNQLAQYARNLETAHTESSAPLSVQSCHSKLM